LAVIGTVYKSTTLGHTSYSANTNTIALELTDVPSGTYSITAGLRFTEGNTVGGNQYFESKSGVQLSPVFGFFPAFGYFGMSVVVNFNGGGINYNIASRTAATASSGSLTAIRLK